MEMTDEEIKASLADDPTPANLYRLSSAPYLIHAKKLAELLPEQTTAHTIRRRLQRHLEKNPELPAVPKKAPGVVPEAVIAPLEEATRAAEKGEYPLSRLPHIDQADLPDFEPAFQKPYRTNVNDPFTKGW